MKQMIIDVTPDKHEDREHAPLSPSAAERWMLCPGSFAASEGIVSEPSDAALEGTRCHEWSEKLIRTCQDIQDGGMPGSAYDELILEIENEEGDEMAMHANKYVLFLDKLKASFSDTKFVEYEEYIETRVGYTQNIWGTLDFGCARKSKSGQWQAIIADLKYGRGVEVTYEKGIYQLICYLIGLENKLETRFEKAWMYVYQPRISRPLPYVRIAVTRQDVDVWRKKLLKAEVLCLDMKEGRKEPKFKAGDHCRFCPANPTCPTFKAYAQAGALQILDDADNLPSTLPAIERIPLDDLVEIHRKKKQIEHFLQNIDHYLLHRALQQKPIAGLKVVEARSNRRWKDLKTVTKGLTKLGINPYKKKLINIGEAEEIIGKNKLDHLTHKPPGKLQLAEQNDPRPTAVLGKDSLDLLD